MTSSDALRDVPQELPGEAVRHGQPAISWTPRLLVGLDVAAQRKSAWVSMTACASILAMVLLAIATKLLLSVTSQQVIDASLMIYVAAVWFVTGWIGDLLAYRRHRRPARADEIAVLRRYARLGTWPRVQTTAGRWRRNSPRYPITIAVILKWEDEAARKISAAVPPTVAEQAAVQAHALAFE
jgi:hypothetical protein